MTSSRLALPLLLLLGALVGCLSLGGQRRPCPEGTVAADCATAWKDKCDVWQPLVHNFLCLPPDAVSFEEARRDLNASLLAANADCVSEIDTDCQPIPGSDNSLPPKDEEVPATFGPPRHQQAWGDKPCSDCVTSACPNDRAKCTADATCACLDACQATGTPADQCDCPGPLDTYNAFQACAADHCTEACSGASAEGCTCP